MVHVQAVGETWEKFPELKFLALKRMYKYMVRPSLHDHLPPVSPACCSVSQHKV